MRSLIVASECCAGRFPPNTRAGFDYCLGRPFDGIEFDVHLTADGHVVAHHDYRVNPRIARTESGAWLDAPGPALSATSLAALRRYDVGRYRSDARERAAYPNYRACDGERMPTLAELLERYAARGADATLWIELKTTPFQRDVSSEPRALAAAVVDAVTRAGVQGRTVLLAFEWDVLAIARGLSRDVELDFLTLNEAHVVALNRSRGRIDPRALYGAFDPREFGGSFPRAIAAAGGHWWGPHVGDVSADDVAQARALGLRVNVWDADADAATLERALALGADAITLSDPDRLVERGGR